MNDQGPVWSTQADHRKPSPLLRMIRRASPGLPGPFSDPTRISLARTIPAAQGLPDAKLLTGTRLRVCLPQGSIRPRGGSAATVALPNPEKQRWPPSDSDGCGTCGLIDCRRDNGTGGRRVFACGRANARQCAPILRPTAMSARSNSPDLELRP